MLRKITAQFVILSLIFSSSVFAIECSNPFPAPNQFKLVEKLNCGHETTPVVLQITAFGAAPQASNPYFSPGCDNKSPYFNLYSGGEIIDFSNTLEGAHAKSIIVTQACDGAPLFRVERETKIFETPTGKKVNTNARVFSQDASATLLAYVQTDEDKVNALTIRGPDDNVLLSATKTLKQTGNACEGVWSVTGGASNQLAATMISYLLTLKDNEEFACDTTPTQAPKGLSGAAAVIVGVSIGAVAVLGGVITAACYCMRNNPRYDKVRLIN